MQSFAAPEFPGARAFAGSVSKKWIKRRPDGTYSHETKQRPAGGFGDEAAGPVLCEQLVAQKAAPNGLLDMRKSSDATAAALGQRSHEENRWIKSGSRIDLEGMRTDSINNSRGHWGLAPDLEKTDRCAAHF